MRSFAGSWGAIRTFLLLGWRVLGLGSDFLEILGSSSDLSSVLVSFGALLGWLASL